MSEQTGRYQRSATGMIGAMVVLLLVIGVFVAFRALTRKEPDSAVKAVDYAATAKFARAKADFDLVAPVRLPAGWKATSVTFTEGPGSRWHLGQLTDEDDYVGLEQGDASVSSMVSTYVDEEATREEPVVINGASWTSWSDDGGDRALVRRESDTTTLVVGTAPQDDLVSYIDTLR